MDQSGLMVGPYRIDRELGVGGMGRVYRAYDQRLDRWVALKQIRRQAAEDDQVRARFRREARAVAKLNHPGIVQIYDLIESEEGDWIIMELVEGRSLAEKLRTDTLSIDEALAVGGEVAEALAEAHRQGIIHRDLKPENVMLSEGGRVKVLDFGLAKRLWQQHGEREETLSVAGRILGTSRSMSPEQAQGQSVDQRSDLFSLGSLLYEALAGSPPFQAADPIATLTRVCTYRQPPLHQARRDVPEELSRVVDRLLEKDPDLRPQTAEQTAVLLREVSSELPRVSGSDSAVATDDESTLCGWPITRGGSEVSLFAPTADRPSPAAALGDVADIVGDSASSPPPPGEPGTASLPREDASGLKRRIVLVVMAALAIAVVGFATRWALRPVAAPIYVAALRPELVGELAPAEASMVSAGAQVALVQGLLRLEGVATLAEDQVDSVSGTPVEVARSLSADEVVRARLDCALSSCHVALDRISGSDGRILWTSSFRAPIDNPYLLATGVIGHLRRAYADHGTRTDAGGFEVDPVDFERFLGARERFLTRTGETDLDRLIEELAAVRRDSPRFALAHVLEADIWRYRFVESREPSFLEQALDLLATAEQIAPHSREVHHRAFLVNLQSGRLADAEAALGRLESVEPSDARTLADRALLETRRGRPGPALELMRRAAERHPSTGLLLDLADMEYRQGEVDAARANLERLLARSPDYFVARSTLAQVELLAGDLGRAAAMYEDLVERSPGVSQLSNLGLAYLFQGRYAEACGLFRRARERAPNHPSLALNLADCELLAGRKEAADELYRAVLDLVEIDPVAGDWQPLATRAQALGHLGRSTESVAAVQKAMRLEPDSPQVAFEAALVYSLAGELSSAVVNAERAFAGGVEARWFELPWFDEVRALPEWPPTDRDRPREAT